MKNLYIVGDSYCFYRKDEHNHWPARLAKLLNLNLEGLGFPGHGWWPVRKHLLEYIKSNRFDHTEYFIFCHTEPCRLLSSNPIFDTSSNEADLAKKIWHTYIHTHDVSMWCMQQWFQELNKLLQEKKVIHLQCFKETQQYFSMLDGIKFTTPLIKLSVESAGGDWDTPHWGDKSVHVAMNNSHNHFSVETNKLFAEFLFNKINSNNLQDCLDDINLS